MVGAIYERQNERLSQKPNQDFNNFARGLKALKREKQTKMAEESPNLFGRIGRIVEKSFIFLKYRNGCDISCGLSDSDVWCSFSFWPLPSSTFVSNFPTHDSAKWFCHSQTVHFFLSIRIKLTVLQCQILFCWMQHLHYWPVTIVCTTFFFIRGHFLCKSVCFLNLQFPCDCCTSWETYGSNVPSEIPQWNFLVFKLAIRISVVHWKNLWLSLRST